MYTSWNGYSHHGASLHTYLESLTYIPLGKSRIQYIITNWSFMWYIKSLQLTHFETVNVYPLIMSPHFSCSPIPNNHPSVLYFCEFDYFGFPYINEIIRSCGICLPVSGLGHNIVFWGQPCWSKAGFLCLRLNDFTSSLWYHIYHIFYVPHLLYLFIC